MLLQLVFLLMILACTYFISYKHNLPALTSVAVIAGLNPGQSNSYCDGYIGVGHGIVEAARQTAIAQAIGCTISEF